MSDFDFLAFCKPGTILQTRDRREVRVTEVDRQRGIISGSVQMMGPCRWRSNGRFADAPAGAAGPLDLVAPSDRPSTPSPDDSKRTSLREALQDPTSRGYCCD